MQMRAQKVSFFSRNVRRMYLEAFPAKERMPFPMMVAMSKLWHTDFLEFYDGKTLCGSLCGSRYTPGGGLSRFGMVGSLGG